MNKQKLTSIFWGALLASVLAILVIQPATAKNNPTDHPIRVLKARYQNDQSRGGLSSARGNMTIWLQNSVGVTVDGIEIEVELYNDRGRKVETLKKKIDKLDAGEKKIVTFRWDVIAEKQVKPKFFIEYNAGTAKKPRFQGDSPTWQ